MELTVLASGSKGNCSYLRGERGALLVDAGLSAREILRRLSNAGADASVIEGILVTHEHIDHIRGVDVLARKLGVPIYATGGTLEAFNEKCGPMPGGRLRKKRLTSAPTSPCQEPSVVLIPSHQRMVSRIQRLFLHNSPPRP